jgi:glycosyltransferase involved in cell wall biosynthesis
MKLSIGVPAYNQGKFLRETLESILHQDIPFHEIVVSNNHSTDSTAQVLAEVQQEYPGRIRVVIPPQHLTMSANWNFTASHLTADWFSLLSSDDLVLPNFVRSIQTAAAQSDAVLIRGGYRMIDAEGKSLCENRLLSVSRVTKPPKTIHEQRFGAKGSFAAFALRRDVWERAGRFPEELAIVCDWGMWLLAGALGNIVTTRDIIAAYRVGHQASMNRERIPAYLRDEFIVYRQILPRAARLGGFGTPRWIAVASGKSFRRVLAYATKWFPARDERLAVIEVFRPWAEATGNTSRLERFACGEVFHITNFTNWLYPQKERVLDNTVRRLRR